MQIVVTIDRDPYDPFMGAMQQLRASMLAYYAHERGLECKIAYHKHFTWRVVEIEDEAHKGMDLIHHLANRGCVDIHVYTTDEITADMIETFHKGLFRVCCGRFTVATI
jgi:hypothetical protein